jgi:hypothetical protein
MKIKYQDPEGLTSSSGQASGRSVGAIAQLFGGFQDLFFAVIAYLGGAR